MIEKDEIERCPKCGSPDIYVGAWKIECGYDENCPNWTQRRADEINQVHMEQQPTLASPDTDTEKQTSRSSSATTKKSKTKKTNKDDDEDIKASWGTAYQMDLDYDDDTDTPIYPYYDYGADYPTD